MMESRHAQRKNEHLSLAAKYYDQVHQHHYFDQVRLIHDSLPEMTTDDVDLHVQLADNLEIECPFYIEAMTGGSVAVVGENTVLTENIVVEELKSKKLNLIEEKDPNLEYIFNNM